MSGETEAINVIANYMSVCKFCSVRGKDKNLDIVQNCPERKL